MNLAKSIKLNTRQIKIMYIQELIYWLIINCIGKKEIVTLCNTNSENKGSRAVW